MTNIQMGQVKVQTVTATEITDEIVERISELLGPGWNDKAKHDVWVAILNGITRAQSIIMRS
jgi:hypothetical protein